MAAFRRRCHQWARRRSRSHGCHEGRHNVSRRARRMQSPNGSRSSSRPCRRRPSRSHSGIGSGMGSAPRHSNSQVTHRPSNARGELKGRCVSVRTPWHWVQHRHRRQRARRHTQGCASSSSRIRLHRHCSPAPQRARRWCCRSVPGHHDETRCWAAGLAHWLPWGPGPVRRPGTSGCAERRPGP